MKKNLLFILLFAFQIVNAQTKNEVDSLTTLVATTKKDSVKVSVLNKLVYHFLYNDAQKAKTLLRQSEQLALAKSKKYGYNETVFLKGAIYIIAGNSDSAYVFYKKAYDLAKKNKFKPIEVLCINGFGMINWNRGNFDKGLNYFFKALQLNESLPKKQQINASLFYNNIGLIYTEKRLYEKALSYCKIAYELRVKDNMLKEQSVSLNNIGICYTNLKKTKEAIATFQKGTAIAKMVNDNITFYKIKHNLANLYADNSEYKKAIQLYLQVLNKPNGVITNPRDLVILYGCVSNTYCKLNRFSEALKYANLGLAIVEKNPELEQYADNIYNALTKSNFHLGNIKNGDYYLTKHYNFLKNMFSENSKNAIAEMEVKYETEKREKQLLQSKVAIAEKNLAIKNKNTQFLIASILAMVVFIIGFLVYRQQKFNNKQQKQEFELKSAIAQIENQSKLQEQRLQISRDLHDNIGSHLTFIISSVDSIKYAFDIQNEKLDAKLSSISNFAKTTIVELRDTIWAMNKKEITFEDLQSRISNFIEDAKMASLGIDFLFTTDGNCKDAVFSTIEGISIYRIIQEAVNNALKHAHANEIEINVHSENSNFQIQIKDNGKGFDGEKIAVGNGLSNLKKRAKEIDGEINIISKSGFGTEVSLFLKKG